MIWNRLMPHKKKKHMKMHKFKIALIVFLSLCLGIMAKTEIRKAYFKEFPSNRATQLDISNRYGKVLIENSSNDQVTISVEVSVEAASEKKAEHILNQIDILLMNDNNHIQAITQIEGKGWSGNVKLNIDYTISMPAYVNTHLENKYGQVSIANITGHFRGEVKYGSFNANRLVPDDKNFINELDLAYCNNSSVRYFSRLNLTLGYSKLKLGLGDALNFEAKYSDLKIEEIALIKGELAYTDCAIEEALNVSIKAKYSDMDLGRISACLEVETKYGDIDIAHLGRHFDWLKIEAAYSDVDIRVEEGSTYQLDLNTHYGDIDVPPLHIEQRDDEGSERALLGYVGQPSEASPSIAISCNYGDISIANF